MLELSGMIAAGYCNEACFFVVVVVLAISLAAAGCG